MERLLLSKLIEWKDTSNGAPLLLKGARHTGKTYLLKYFGQTFFPKAHYFDFEKEGDLRSVFESDLDPSKIIKALSLRSRKQIKGGELLFFDEIQTCPEAITSLMYFQQEKKELFVCAAGSFLGNSKELNNLHPVGKLFIQRLHPLNFLEFCMALEDNLSVDFFHSVANSKVLMPISDEIHIHMWNLLQIYMVVGGLPKAVETYLTHRGDLPFAFEKIRIAQAELVLNYMNDIAKHSEKIDASNIEKVFRTIPFQLSSGKKRFSFDNVLPGKKGYASVSAHIDWLMQAGFILKKQICSTGKHPFSAGVKGNLFKLYLFDVGILRKLLEIPPRSVMTFGEGYLPKYFAENFVATELISSEIEGEYSWQEKTAHIEFLIQRSDSVCPVQVQPRYNSKTKSLKVFQEKYDPPCSILLCGENKSNINKNNTIHLPLYLASKLRLLNFV